MMIHELKQGSPEWHQHRIKFFNASEASSMLGLNDKTTRNELLRIKHTGNEKEYSDWINRVLFANGHKYEAMARPIVEEMIGDDLYPVTCSEGIYSSSCDGLSIDGLVAFEHKQWSEALASSVRDKVLPEEHQPQCQQILMVTGAEKLIFVCSDGTKQNFASMEVSPDLMWFERIKDGWRQFGIDLKKYEPREIKEKPETEVIMQLPVLSVQIKGEVTASNLSEFRQSAEAFITNIKMDLKNDEDFANAESTVKFCSETEKKIELSKDAAIAQTASIDELMRAMDYIKESFRAKRLALEKLVKTQKEEIKKQIIEQAHSQALDHAKTLSDEIELVKFFTIADPLMSKSDFQQATKNKRTLSSLHNAIDTHLANVKISLDNKAKGVRKNIDYLSRLTDAQCTAFHDLQHIVTKDFDDFVMLTNARVIEYDKRIEEETQRKLEVEKRRIANEKERKLDAEKLTQPSKIEGNSSELVSAIPATEPRESNKEPTTMRSRQDQLTIEARESIIEQMPSLGYGQAKELVTLIADSKIKHITITH